MSVFNTRPAPNADWKVGDYALCINVTDAGNTLDYGRVYKVEHLGFSADLILEGVRPSWYKKRFLQVPHADMKIGWAEGQYVFFLGVPGHSHLNNCKGLMFKILGGTADTVKTEIGTFPSKHFTTQWELAYAANPSRFKSVPTTVVVDSLTHADKPWDPPISQGDPVMPQAKNLYLATAHVVEYDEKHEHVTSNKLLFHAKPYNGVTTADVKNQVLLDIKTTPETKDLNHLDLRVTINPHVGETYA